MSLDHGMEGFGVGRCPACRGDVLTYPEWDPEDGGELRLCVHCDETVPGKLRWIEGAELGELGYSVDDPSAADSGCVSCGAGGCAVAQLSKR